MNTPGAKIYAAITPVNFDVLPLMLGLGVLIASSRKWKSAACPSSARSWTAWDISSLTARNPESRLRPGAGDGRIFCATAIGVYIPEGTFTGEDGVRPFQLGAFRPRSRLVCRSFPSLWPHSPVSARRHLRASPTSVPSRFRRRSIQALLHARVILPILHGTNSFACVTPHVRDCALLRRADAVEALTSASLDAGG